MDINFFKNIEKYFNFKSSDKVLILNDPYFSYNPTKENKLVKDIIHNLRNKRVKVIEDTEEFIELKENYEIIINIFFSSIFINQLKFFNKILKLSVFETRFVNIVPFYGFINFSSFNFNPVFVKNLSEKGNFKIKEIAFLDRYGKKLQINSRYIDKVFFQSTEKGNQSFVDHLYNELNTNYRDIALLFDTTVSDLSNIDIDFYKPKRIGHHLSGHSSKTWVDEGAFNKILELIDVKTMIDVGCGPGDMINYVKQFGVKGIGVDGDNSIIRNIDKEFFLHDFTTGPFLTNLYFDLCWCVEFLEHVEEKYMNNYFDSFKKCKFVFCTFAPKGKGGYHHVNTQSEKYWIENFEKYNFVLEKNATEKIRSSSTINKNFVRENGLLFKNTRKV